MHSRYTAAIVAIALASGCTAGTADDFSNVLPDERILINLPVDDTAGLRSEVGDTAEYYLFTAQVTRDVNGLIGDVLDAVEHISGFDPTWSDDEDNTAVWGPWEDNGVDGMMAIHYDEAADTYEWSLNFKETGADEEAWETIFAGNVYEGATDETGAGALAINFDALSAIDDEEVDVTGVFYVEYDVTEEGTDATAGWDSFSEDGSEVTDIAYFYSQEHGEGGMMDLVYWADITGNDVQEAHIVRSRWHKEGDGRSDVYVTDGDFGALVYNATECWQPNHSVTFYEENASFTTSGDEEMCTFAEPDWNESDDAPAAR